MSISKVRRPFQLSVVTILLAGPTLLVGLTPTSEASVRPSFQETVHDLGVPCRGQRVDIFVTMTKEGTDSLPYLRGEVYCMRGIPNRLIFVQLTKDDTLVGGCTAYSAGESCSDKDRRIPWKPGATAFFIYTYTEGVRGKGEIRERAP